MWFSYQAAFCSLSQLLVPSRRISMKYPISYCNCRTKPCSCWSLGKLQWNKTPGKTLLKLQSSGTLIAACISSQRFVLWLQESANGVKIKAYSPIQIVNDIVLSFKIRTVVRADDFLFWLGKDFCCWFVSVSVWSGSWNLFLPSVLLTCMLQDLVSFDLAVCKNGFPFHGFFFLIYFIFYFL